MSIAVRLLCEDDFAPLYQLYCALAERIPYQPMVGAEQFAQQLTTSSSIQPAGVFHPDAEIAVVALDKGRPIAYANGCLIVDERAQWAKPGEAFIRLVLADRNHERAARAVIAVVVAHLQTFKPESIKAFDVFFGPVFYGTGCGTLYPAWSWLGHWLVREGFVPSVRKHRLRRPLSDGHPAPEPLPLPVGFAFQRYADPRTGRAKDRCEFSFTLNDGDGVPVGRCVSYYAEEWIRGAGKCHLFTHSLQVDEFHQGQGYGRLLLRQAQVGARAGGAAAAMLTTDVDNFRAIALYNAEHYRVVDTSWSFKLARGA